MNEAFVDTWNWKALASASFYFPVGIYRFVPATEIIQFILDYETRRF